MNERIPTVQKNEPITAEAWNRIVGKINEQSGAPAEATRAPLKGEFWLENASSAIMPAFSLAYITGFAASFATVDAADSALVANRIVLNGALSGSSSAALAQLLEPIQPGAVGRATLVGGAGVFAVVAGTAALSVGARVKISNRSLTLDSDGDFKIVAADAATRFALLQLAPAAGASYTAGTGINIYNNEISSNTSFCWAAPKTSGSGNDVVTTATNGYNSGDSPNLYFSNQFKRVVDSDSQAKVVALRTQSVEVVTDVVNGVATKSTIVVPLYANNG